MIDIRTIKDLPPDITTRIARAISSKASTDELFKMNLSLLDRQDNAASNMVAVIHQLNTAIMCGQGVTIAAGPTVAFASGSMSLMLGLLLQAKPERMP